MPPGRTPQKAPPRKKRRRLARQNEKRNEVPRSQRERGGLLLALRWYCLHPLELVVGKIATWTILPLIIDEKAKIHLLAL